MSKETKAGHTLEDFKADVHPRMIEGCGPIRGLSQKNNLSKNPVLCGVITVIYQLPIETECRRTQNPNSWSGCLWRDTMRE